MKTPKRKNLHYFLLKVTGNQTIRLAVKARNASQPVTLSREMVDVMKGTEGMAVTCANALCALRMNGAAFPHPVYLAEFTDNRAYVVDKLDKRGVPISCVVYAHGEGEFQKEFDTKTKQRLAKMSGVEKQFMLRPIGVRQGTAKQPHHSPGGTGTKRKTVMGKGAIARAMRAGITLNTKAA